MDALNTSTEINNFAETVIVTFSWYDYILFTVMLIYSAFVGVYFGCFGTKQSTKNEYLMGDKKMKPLPVAISLIASNTSTMFLLSLPADVYQFGSSYVLSIFSIILLTIITIYVYLPVFFNLQTNTTYEYLEKRFDKRTRSLASFLFVLACIFYIPMLIYTPALAFAAASGVNTHVIIVIFSGVCIFYTAIGGLKAVIWTDALQFIITIATFLAVLILGIKSTGGILVVWQKALDGKRLDIFDFDPDPTKRDSFWIILIGVTVNVMSYTTIDQSFVQKFLSVATFRNSALSMVYYAVGVIIITIISIFIGLIMYVRYSECDLFTSGIIETNEQLVPYYVLDVSRNIPGFSGLFFAGLFSAALSAQSAFLNCLSGTIYEDFVKTFLKPTNHDVSKILKIIALITGIISSSMIFLIEILGNIFPLYISLLGLTCGPVLGIFTSGILFPTTNAKGAFYGGIGALLIAACIVIPIKYYEIQGILKYAPKPLSTNNCSLNQTTFIFDENEAREPHFIFRISFYYFTVIGTASSVIFSLIISYMTNKNDPPVDKALLSPVIHFLLPRDEAVDNKVKYNTIEQALENLTASSDQVVSTDYAE